jgi:hypothetical protein
MLETRQAHLRAEDRAEKQVAEVPGDDIFGFISPMAPGKAGDLEYVNENDGRVGKRPGTYGAFDSKFALPYIFADNWWLAGPSSSQGLRPFQNVMFVRRPITSSFLIRWVGSFGLAIPAPGLMTYWRSG